MKTLEHPKAKETILNSTPYIQSYGSSAGGRSDEYLAWAVFQDGSKVQLEYEVEIKYASREPDYFRAAPTVREQLSQLGSIVGIIVSREYTCSWEDYEEGIHIHPEEWKERIPYAPNGEVRQEFYVPLKPIDWGKVRKRVENCIRKDEAAMKACASLLNVKLW